MVRTPLTRDERERGRALGGALQRARGDRSAAEVALAAGISLDTLRKIERGAIATPTFFTVASLARVLGLDLTELASTVTDSYGATSYGSTTVLTPRRETAAANAAGASASR
jgi:transcriptional regulator with XRE-family HTH domain